MTARLDLLRQALDERILCLDGATGTWLQGAQLGPQDFGGDAFDGCNEHLVLTRPDVVTRMHREYLEAGADILETNTFGSTGLVLAEYPPLHEQAYTITRRAAELARAAAEEASTPGKPRFVAGSMGPTTKAISVTGGVRFDELIDTFDAQGQALLDGGADYLLLETCQDTRNVKAGLLALQRLAERRGAPVPVAVSGTIEPMGTMLAGQSAESLYISVAHVDLLYIGLNCATGPEFMADHVRALAELAETRVACVPNAGLPDENGRYLETPRALAAHLARFADLGWLNVVGGCCGTTPAHIRAVSDAMKGLRPRPATRHNRVFYSGIDWVESTDDNRPLLVGERTNVIGSRKFKQLITEERFEEASEIARAQVRGGAHVIDVCTANPDRDERADMVAFLDQLIRKVKAPLMIDTTDAHVLEVALTYCQGKAIINSINLEDGEARFREVVPLARRYGAALVVGCIDEDRVQGMAVTRARKLEVAERSHQLLCESYGVDERDIVFDPLVFPCATGDANYLGSARETVEGVRLIKERFPRCRTVLGISNVSFGLPAAGREVVNSVFLYECTKAGLDLAIVNSEKLERYASIPEEERRLAERVLFETDDVAIADFKAHFASATGRPKKESRQLPIDERLAACVIEGSKEGLLADLDEKLRTTAPLDIINGPLMAGMDEVGRLFNDNQLIVAEVLQSAEVMKAAVAHLQPHMAKSESMSRGKVLLATVKGDVHDIGKNLVEIILGNNGYEIVNLGIKVPPQDIVAAVREHKPDVVGLSGLLVKSAQMMVATAEEMTAAGCTPDMLVGGAALTRSFTRKRIASAYGGRVLYARDAMDGLALAGRLIDDGQWADIEALIHEERARFTQDDGAPTTASTRVREVVGDAPPQPPPDLDRHQIDAVPLDVLWPYVNPKMLVNKHLGYRGDWEDACAQGDSRALEIRDVIERVRAEGRGGAFVGGAVFQWIPVEREGERLRLLGDGPSVEWSFPRQKDGGLLALPDFVAPRGDHVGLFVVTFGQGVRQWADARKAEGRFLESHVIQSIALEGAEALAEWLHTRMRDLWGFPDAPSVTMDDRWKARYRGKRYSPGYPACPEMELQDGIFARLRPASIGVVLTEGHMMEPEASVSAIVVHHPEARYFAV